MTTYKSPPTHSQKPIIYLSKQSTNVPPYDKTLDEWFTVNNNNKSQNSSSQTCHSSQSSSDEGDSHSELRSLMTSPTSISALSSSSVDQLCPCCQKPQCSTWKKLLKSITKLENETRLAAEIGQSLLQKNDVYLLEKNQLKEQLELCQEKNDELHISLDEMENYIHKLSQEKDKWLWQYEKSQKLLTETEMDLENVNQKCNSLLNDLDLTNIELDKLKHFKLMSHQSDHREDTLKSKLEDLKQELSISRKNELTSEVKYKKLMARYESLSCSYQDLRGRLPSSKNNTNLAPAKPLSTITPPTAADIQQATTDELVTFIKELVSSNHGLKSELLDTQNRLDELVNNNSNNNSNNVSASQSSDDSVTAASSKLIAKTKKSTPSSSSSTTSSSNSSSSTTSVKKNEKPIIKPRRHRSTNSVVKPSSTSSRSKSREKLNKSMTTPLPPIPQSTTSTPSVIHHHYHYYVNNKEKDQENKSSSIINNDLKQQDQNNKFNDNNNYQLTSTSTPIPILPQKTATTTTITSLSPPSSNNHPHQDPIIPTPSLSKALSYHSLPNQQQEDFISQCLMMDQQFDPSKNPITSSFPPLSTSLSSLLHHPSPPSLINTNDTKSTSTIITEKRKEYNNSNIIIMGNQDREEEEEEEKTPYTSLLMQTQHIIQRLQSTDIKSLNRKLERSFDMNELTTMSNAILQNINADIETMDARFLWLSSLSSSFDSNKSNNINHMSFKINEFFSIVQLIQDLLKEQCHLFITLNLLQATYVNKIQENDKKLKQELLSSNHQQQMMSPPIHSSFSFHHHQNVSIISTSPPPPSPTTKTSNVSSSFHETSLNPIHWLSSLIQGDMNHPTTTSSSTLSPSTSKSTPSLLINKTKHQYLPKSLSSTSLNNTCNNNNNNNNNKFNHISSMKKKQQQLKKKNTSMKRNQGLWQSFSSLFDDGNTNTTTIHSTSSSSSSSSSSSERLDTTKWLGK